MNASPCCCAVRLSVNLWLIVAEEQARENQYKQAAFMLPVKHTDLPLQCVTSFSSFFFMGVDSPLNFRACNSVREGRKSGCRRKLSGHITAVTP